MSRAPQASAQSPAPGGGVDPDDSESSILDKPLARKPRTEVSTSLIHFLFASMVQYSMQQTNQGSELEDKLHEMGIRVGHRTLVLASCRERVLKREIRILPMLTFVSQTCWKLLFGRTGDLFRNQEAENEYMMTDNQFLLTRYTTTAKGEGFINCGAFGAGIIEGVLCGAQFPASVVAHMVPDTVQQRTGHQRAITFFIKFLPEVIQREKQLEGKP